MHFWWLCMCMLKYFLIFLKKCYLWEKCWKILFTHDISFHGFFYFTLFFMKVEFKNIYHKMKNSILIFSNFFLWINFSIKLRWKKICKKWKTQKGFYQLKCSVSFLFPNPNSNCKAVIISADGLLVKSSYLPLSFMCDTFFYVWHFLFKCDTFICDTFM